MTRKILGVVGGLVLAFLFIMLLEMVSSYVFAPPALDPSDPEAAKEMMRRMPAVGFISVLLIYLFSTFVGGFTAAKIAREPWASWVVAGFVLVATIANVIALPHPVWFTVLAVILIAAGGWFGGRAALGGGQMAEGGDAAVGAGVHGADRPGRDNDWNDSSNGGGDGGD